MHWIEFLHSMNSKHARITALVFCTRKASQKSAGRAGQQPCTTHLTLSAGDSAAGAQEVLIGHCLHTALQNLGVTLLPMEAWIPVSLIAWRAVESLVEIHMNPYTAVVNSGEIFLCSGHDCEESANWQSHCLIHAGSWTDCHHLLIFANLDGTTCRKLIRSKVLVWTTVTHHLPSVEKVETRLH